MYLLVANTTNNNFFPNILHVRDITRDRSLTTYVQCVLCQCKKYPKFGYKMSEIKTGQKSTTKLVLPHRPIRSIRSAYLPTYRFTTTQNT